MNTPQERCEGTNNNYQLLARIIEAKRYQPFPKPNPTMTYKVDARCSEMPQAKPIKLNKSKFAIE